MNLVTRIHRAIRRFAALPERIVRIQQALGRIEARQTAGAATLGQSEFRVFSQWGEDGIIQQLVRAVPIPRRLFVEFGVENYLESNTRFLLTNDQWAGLVMDGSAKNIAFIKEDAIYWESNLKAQCAFITRENINELLLENGITGDIGLLSVDIDGNDYWVWSAIDAISPRIVICEYNSLWGPHEAVTVPYDAAFERGNAHFSTVYFGASIAALDHLARKKGYTLVGSNAAGCNAFFVRNDVPGSLVPIEPAAAHRQAVFREAHDTQGHLTFDDAVTRLKTVSDLMLQDVRTGSVRRVADIYWNGRR
jgi:hypothetical protein